MKVFVEPAAPLGTYPVGLEMRSFERLQFRQIPFELTVRPAPPPLPPQFRMVKVEGTSRIENGVILVRTDNPQVEVTTRLIKVHANWANGVVPQELTREGNGWRFDNGDLHFFVGNGEAEAGNRPSRVAQ
jgi:hypothetical protein